MPELADDSRQTVLADAAALWAAGDGEVAPPGDPGRAVGDLPGFLAAYYRLAETDDLTTAGPRRVAAAAAWHAALGASRPQGRAAVAARESGKTSLTGASTVIDIVTDDMPYLVDSVTMELNRHLADIRLIVHPLLTVQRDVTGVAHGTVQPNIGAEPPAGTIQESWIHVELTQQDDLAQLASDLRRVLDDLRIAMEDQRRMRSAARELVVGLTDGDPEREESGELLAWLSAGHFLFLGYREYDLAGQGEAPAPRPVPGTGLGILRHDGADSFAVTRPDERGDGEDAKRLRPLVLAKSSTKSTVYRPSYLDYVAVRTFGPDGEPVSEHRFLGLYTQSAYTESITRIPVLRRKLDLMLEAAGLPADSHDGKDLIEILEGYPREELFEISVAQLTPIALAVLRLGERKQVRLFLRPDVYGRYMSCLVYLPRDRYTTKVRLACQEILRRAFGGVSVDYSAMVSNSALARLHVVVHGEPGRPLAHPDPLALQAEIAAAVRSWDEDLAAEAERQLGVERAATVVNACSVAIPDPYKADTRPAEAVADFTTVERLQELSLPFGLRLGISPNGGWRLRIFRMSPITLSDVLPQLQHMGLEVVDEHPYELCGTMGPFWIYDFGLRRRRARLAAAEADAARGNFEAALTALWRDQTEDDAFNGLVLDAGLTWRQIVLLRAYARYLRQIGARFSQDYLQRVLRGNPAIARLLVRLFESRFDPARQAGAAERCEAISEELRGALDEVVSLDHDRILRSYLALIEATLRTNYFQAAGEAPYLVLKLAPEGVPGVPAPRPKFEIFVYSPRFEAVHLRFGAVARGGLRWSERPEDYRTEVLGLVKAQEVKNAVIVPSGAKGGFVCKRLPDPADREAYQAEVLACYQMFISGMLDITDNIVGDQVVPPARRGPRRGRRPVPGGGRGQGHRDVLRHREQDRGTVRVLAR